MNHVGCLKNHWYLTLKYKEKDPGGGQGKTRSVSSSMFVHNAYSCKDIECNAAQKRGTGSASGNTEDRKHDNHPTDCA